MKFRMMSLAVAVLASAALVSAAELTSGLQAGRNIGPFDVVKVAGAEDDGKKAGDELCYRCKYGSRPMVMVFTRKTGDELAGLVKGLDKAIAENESKKLAAFVNVLGADRDAAEAEAKKYAEHVGAKQIPFVVPLESENGPEDYGINPDAEVTVIIAKESKVVANKAFGKGEFKKDSVSAVLEEVKKVL